MKEEVKCEYGEEQDSNNVFTCKRVHYNQLSPEESMEMNLSKIG